MFLTTTENYIVFLLEVHVLFPLKTEKIACLDTNSCYG